MKKNWVRAEIGKILVDYKDLPLDRATGFQLTLCPLLANAG